MTKISSIRLLTSMYSLLLSGHMFGHSESNCNWEEEGNVFGRKNEDGVRDVI